jgi:hypothetical protein
VVSQAAVGLREAVRRAAGRRRVVILAPWPERRRWAVGLSHDLDVVRAWPAFTALRVFELLRRFELAQIVRVKLSALAAIGRDPIGAGVRGTLESEPRGRVASTWFILCGTPTWATMRAGDLTYLPESKAARRILDTIKAAGGELALHGSFETMDRHAAFSEQRQRLARLTGAEIGGIRQHYVRMRPGNTQRGMAEAGFQYDSTFGFPDRNGFRLGVADVVPAWDEERGRTLALEEVPLTWMERALSKYVRIEDPETWVADALELAAAARAVEGLWVGVWHPNSTAALGFPGATEAYRRLVTELLAPDPFVAPLGTIAAWRRARRGTRIGAVAPDGRVELRAPTSPFPVEPDAA